MGGSSGHLELNLLPKLIFYPLLISLENRIS